MNTNVNPAQILGRITVRGRLHLAAPLLIGEGESGEERNDRDIHVLRSKAGVPFIPMRGRHPVRHNAPHRWGERTRRASERRLPL